MKKIVIVEDHVERAYLLSKILQFQGYQVIYGFDSSQALQTVEKVKPDLIMLGTIFKNTVYSKLTRDRDFKKISLIIVMSQSAPRDTFETASNVVGFVPQPFSMNHLRATVDAVWNN
jgi:DNA-binding response OmpR family regulator